MGRRHIWPKDRYDRLAKIAESVKKLYDAGVDVSSRAMEYSKEKEHRQPWKAASNAGIGWVEVLAAAGIPIWDVMKGKGWPDDKEDRLEIIAAKVRELYDEGVNVSASEMQTSKKKKFRRLWNAAKGVKIPWKEVVAAAGISPGEYAERCRLYRQLRKVLRKRANTTLWDLQTSRMYGGLWKLVEKHIPEEHRRARLDELRG